MTLNFSGMNTLSFVLVAALVLLLILLPTVRRMGARVHLPETAPEPAPSEAAN